MKRARSKARQRLFPAWLSSSIFDSLGCTHDDSRVIPAQLTLARAEIPDRLSSLPFKLFTNLQRMTREKFCRGQPPATFTLQFRNPQRALATADYDAGFVR